MENKSTFCPIAGPLSESELLEMKEIFQTAKTIAVVGLSPKKHRESYRVAAYLKENGYRIVPVRPNGGEILGEKTYDSLKDIPFPIDVVDVFRKPEAVPPIAAEAVNIGAKVLWLQDGVGNPEGERIACEAGLKVVSNRCMFKEHRRLLR